MRDILGVEDYEAYMKPFGGKSVVLEGDFRQILPVVPSGSRSDIVFSTINSSYLWDSCKIYTLSRNMRLQMSDDPIQREELREFAEWMLKVGDGVLGLPNDGEAEIEIPDELLLDDFDNPLEAIFDVAFPDIFSNFGYAAYLKDRAILAPTLEIVEQVNNFIMNKLPGEEREYLSSDSVDTHGQPYNIAAQVVPPAILNDLKVYGLPNHSLTLKVGTPIMLLRNLDQTAGLCNRTRLIVTHLGDHVIGADVISGGGVGQTVFITRMSMCPSESRLPFKLKRRQFPITVSYCMTINKSQGQSLGNVIVYLPRPIFTHGQIYVAVSRVKSKKGLKFLILHDNGNSIKTTRNVVYKEIFQNVVAQSQV
ncbi:hypothetical protein RIF29_11258 [Crotalaria pallida]|uniref:ATP-dependent DNA helicase n=1 Tax=Crotalaria pallida TaxID=3830 RepID=A0AAN9ILY9_CROPI